MSNTSFELDKLIGDKSEYLILNFFQNNKFIYEDKRNNADYRKIDVDFIWLVNGMRYRIEVKTIKNINFINIETVFDVNRKHLSNDWLNCCQATYIFFVCPEENKFISLDYQKFKNWFLPKKNTFKEKVNRTTINGNKKHTSAYVKLNINKIPKELFQIIEL
jgi:hypothetical protein